MDVPPIIWTDAHAHLQDARLAADLPAVVARAKAAGVQAVHVNATRPADWERVAQLAEEYRGFCIPSFGVHPWHIKDCDDFTFAALKNMLLNVPSGVGEIGLDTHCKDGIDALREEWFIRQLDLAEELNRPVSIHCRGAWDRLFEILFSRPPLKAGILLHSYAGPLWMIDKLAERGVCFSFGNAVQRRRSLKWHSIFVSVPLANLLLESDAPDQSPSYAEFSEPADIPEIGNVFATYHGEFIAEIARQTTANFNRLFGALF